MDFSVSISLFMEFIAISIGEYIELHLKNNPSEKREDLEHRLEGALKDYKKGIKCACGNDIWVVGSAFVGNSCFTCITGESTPKEDYEIESAVHKRQSRNVQRHIDEMSSNRINGFFDDDGYEVNSNLIKKPGLCITCIHDDDPNEESFCLMTRYDQQDQEDFDCLAYKKRHL